MGSNTSNAPGPSPSLLIRGARLIDGTGRDPRAEASVLIKGQLIHEVGRRTEVSPPDGTRVIDAQGLTLMPGLIDSHLHMSGMKTDNFVMEMLVTHEGVKLLRSAVHAKQLLEAGYTTVKDCGGVNSLSLKRAIAAGVIQGPRIVAAGYVLTQTFGHGDMLQFLPVEMANAPESGKGASIICDGVDECIKAARYTMREGADFIKITTSGGVFSERDAPDHMQFTPDEVSAIVEVARNAGTFVTTHCLSTSGMLLSIKGGVKTIDHANNPSEEVIGLAKKNGVIFVPTLSVLKRVAEYGASKGFPDWAVVKGKHLWEPTIKNIKWIHDSGATVASGTDFLGTDLMQMGTNASELELLVKYCGFSPMDAIVAATSNGAKACGMGDRLGSVEEGRLADVLLVEGDPSKDIGVLQETSRIKAVIKEGAIEVNRGVPVGTA